MKTGAKDQQFDPQQAIASAQAAYTQQFNPSERLINAIYNGKDEIAALIIYRDYGEIAWNSFLAHHRAEFEKEMQKYIDHPDWVVDLKEHTVQNMIGRFTNPFDLIGPKTMEALSTRHLLEKHIVAEQTEESSPKSSFRRKY